MNNVRKNSLWIHIPIKMAPLAILALIVLIPLSICFIPAMGFPPIVGNLAAARAMREYAAQVYPEWKPEGIWAGYNLVEDEYYLHFFKGDKEYALGYAWSEGQVEDAAREEALLAQAVVDRAIRINGLWIPDQLTANCSIGWVSKDPDTPLVTVTSRVHVPPGLAQAELREQMADVGMKTWKALSPVVPIHRLSVHCGQQEPEKGIIWTVLHLDLEEGQAVTRAMLLTAPVKIK